MTWTIKRDIEFFAPRWLDLPISSIFKKIHLPRVIEIKKRYSYTSQKNAGRAISLTVLNEHEGHIPFRRYYAYDAALAKSCLKFAVVRHPVDRFVSAFYGLKGSACGLSEYSRFVRKNIEPFDTVNDFGAWMASSWLNAA